MHIFDPSSDRHHCPSEGENCGDLPGSLLLNISVVGLDMQPVWNHNFN